MVELLRDSKFTVDLSVPLVCPCGRPLDFIVLQKDGHTEYAIGHLEVLCSPMTWGRRLGELLGLLYANARETGHAVPTYEEFKARTDARLTTIDRTDLKFYGLGV